MWSSEVSKEEQLTTAREARAAEQGFSLIEMVIGMALLTELMILGYLVFDVNTKVARVQTEVAEMQQSQRVANYDLLRTLRMAGRGGVAPAVSININNEWDDSDEIGGNKVIDGSDVLTVRGVLTNDVWVFSDTASPWAYDETAQTGTLTVESLTAQGRIVQNLDILVDAQSDNLPLAVVIADLEDPSQYAVFEIQSVSVSTIDLNGDGDDDQRAVISVSGDGSQGSYNTEYLALSTGGVLPPALTADGGRAVAWAGILEEYRYYVRDDEDLVTGRTRKLSRAQFYPNTDELYRGDDANGAVDIADNVIDVQFALALDLDNSGDISEDPANRPSDEWLFNHQDDVETDDYWGLNDADSGWGNATPFQLLISTMVRSEEIDPGYQSDYTPWHLDHEIDESPNPTGGDEQIERRYRRRVLRSTVDLRNVS